MDEDEEEFYDSLDEDQHLEDVLKNRTVKASKNETSLLPVSTYKTNEDPKKVSLAPERSSAPASAHRATKIPLYVGETDKKDIKVRKKSIQNVGSANQLSSTCVSCETSVKTKLKLENALGKKKQESSYWNIYCQKNGFPVAEDGKTNPATARSMYGSTTNRTFSSFISSCCLSGNTWDAPSVFEKYVPKKYASLRNELTTHDEQEADQESSERKCNSADSDVNNFKSISEIDVLKQASSNTESKMSATSRVMKSRSNTSNMSLRPLTLKSSGPDNSKLELIRRQQEYGQRANSRNRARIIQNLSKIKKEIQNNSNEKAKIKR